MDGVSAYLSSLVDQCPTFAEEITTFKQLHEQKLWYELAQKVHSLLSNPQFLREQETSLGTFYANFIRDFETRVSPLLLVQIVKPIVESYDDSDEAKQLLNETLEKVKSNADANLLCQTLLLHIDLIDENISEVKEGLEQLLVQMESLLAVDPIVKSRVHRLAMDYHAHFGTPGDYFTQALLFLTFTPSESLSASERISISSELAMASLEGESVYNFGELLSYETIGSLKGTSFDWLYSMLVAMSHGAIDDFYGLMKNHSSEFKAHHVLEEKVYLLALLEHIFTQDGKTRVISFSSLSKALKKPMDQIEGIIMRAMSVGLISGKIDQVNQVVSIASALPRVLNTAQQKHLSDKVDAWIDNVEGLGGFVLGVK